MMWLLFVVNVVVTVHDVVVTVYDVVVMVVVLVLSRLRNVPPHIISQIVCKYGIIVELY